MHVRCVAPPLLPSAPADSACPTAAVAAIVQEKELLLREGMRILGLQVGMCCSTPSKARQHTSADLRHVWVQRRLPLLVLALVCIPTALPLRPPSCLLTFEQCLSLGPRAACLCRTALTGPAGFSLTGPAWHSAACCAPSSACTPLHTAGGGSNRAGASLLSTCWTVAGFGTAHVQQQGMPSAADAPAAIRSKPTVLPPGSPCPTPSTRSFLLMLAFYWLVAATLLLFAYCLSTLFRRALRTWPEWLLGQQ